MTAPARAEPRAWIVSARWDLAAFGLPAAASFALLLAGRWAGILEGDTPLPLWVATVLFVDVAHVWATAYRVYLDPAEVRRRSALYLGVPVACYAAGVLAYTISASLFWRLLAYAAVFHFVRQQQGWIRIARRRLGESSRLDRLLDDAAITSAMLYPLLHWHANLPREFSWLIEGDFVPGLPRGAAAAAFPLHVAITAAYVLRQIQLLATGRPVSAGKNLVMAGTWLCWYVGIVVLDSDYAFTVTNVLIHGVPYLALVWRYGRGRYRELRGPVASLFQRGIWPAYLALPVVAAFGEEWGWDRLVWHENGALFPGGALVLAHDTLALVVPLLALPQATHYMLDGWIWRLRPENPDLARYLEME